MPRQGCGEVDLLLVCARGNCTGRGVLEYQPQLALVFARELADHQGAGLGACFPIDVASRIVGEITADAVQIVASPPLEGFELAADEWQNIEQLVRRSNRW